MASPHILFILADDVGYADVGFTNMSRRATTPNLDSLATEGLVLERYYSHQICGPSRVSIQSGRLPIHASVGNEPFSLDGDADAAGMPLQFTSLGEKMRAGGYATHCTAAATRTRILPPAFD